MDGDTKSDGYDRTHRGTVRYDRAPTIRDGDSLSGYLNTDNTGEYVVTDKHGHVVGTGTYYISDGLNLIYDTWEPASGTGEPGEQASPRRRGSGSD